MIKINKPANPPNILTRRGMPETRQLYNEYDRNPSAYRSGRAKFEIQNAIYGAKAVKRALDECQHSKCCYTEMKFRGYYPHVEHFRPKTSVRRGRGKERKYPGYYWLGYTWVNLYLSSQICNTKKSDIFPLVGRSFEARSHHDSILREMPRLVDPGIDDPREHIRFRLDAPIGITRRGRATIELLELRNDRHLREARMKHVEELRFRINVFRKFAQSLDITEQQLAEDARQYLQESVTPHAQFSSMAIDFLKAEIPDLFISG